MKLAVCLTFLLPFAKCLMPATSAFATSDSQVDVRLEGPPGILRMGDRPSFSGTVSNKGNKPTEGLVFYLSLVSLKPGAEEPVDLEDWSAKRTIRIPRLLPGEISTHDWNIRLIDAGDYGIALTVIDPSEQKPVVSQLVRFKIHPQADA